jgi:DNA-binding LytR/AlgR family response regulator
MLLDDEPSVLDMESELIRQQCHHVVSFSAGGELLAFYEKNPRAADAALFDIILDGQEQSGADAAVSLREAGFTGPIVFLSSSREYGPEAIAAKASGYLLKPVDADKIDTVLRVFRGAILHARSADLAGITLKYGGGARRVLLRDIMYVESSHNNLLFHLADGEKITTRLALKDVAPQLLCDSRFAECHRAFVVNLDYISALSGASAMLMDGSEIPVATTSNRFKARYIAYRAGVSE